MMSCRSGLLIMDTDRDVLSHLMELMGRGGARKGMGGMGKVLVFDSSDC